jgi:hypothetical protein|tara:strand:- start:184 stop:603 length:420 start_codon:yes stop_codon:yes gene_type:complete
MSKQSAATQATFRSLEDKVLNIVHDGVKDKAYAVANYAVSISPVYSGAYVESFSIKKPGQGGGRRKSSEARGGKANGKSDNPDMHRETAKYNLYKDIESLGEKGLKGFVLRNRAEHAKDVEHKHGPPYKVFARVRNRFG